MDKQLINHFLAASMPVFIEPQEDEVEHNDAFLLRCLLAGIVKDSGVQVCFARMLFMSRGMSSDVNRRLLRKRLMKASC